MYKVDFLGTKPQLYIENQSTYKTNIGAFFSIIIGILSVLAFIAFVLDLFERQKQMAVLSSEIVN
jgi:hypothetical protein